MRVGHLVVPALQGLAACGVLLYLQSSPIFSASQGAAWDHFTGGRAVETRTPSPATPEDRAVAEVAWRYFAQQTVASGLVNPVENYGNSTLWDQASYGLGTIAAAELGVISTTEAQGRLSAYIDALHQWPRTSAGPPATYANALTLTATDLEGAPVDGGIGWSALDIGRALVSLEAASRYAPELAPRVVALRQAWALDTVVRDGALWGGRRALEGGFEPVQEGRLGYEEYAARAFALLGYDTSEAADLRQTLSVISLYGVQIAADTRTLHSHGASNHIVSEPYLMHAFEFGLDRPNQRLAAQVFLAQEARYRDTGRLTAASEGNLDAEPYFVYNALHADGINWMPVAPDGSQHPDRRTLSTKAAFGWAGLYDDPYGDTLFAQARTLARPKGYVAGLYEASGEINEVFSANTNGVILEAQHYRVKGPFLR